MIRREEFNKILQLVDAGILTSEKGIMNHIDSLSPIIGIEEYLFELDKNPIKKTTNIDDDLSEIINYIANLNALQNLKITKNNYQIKWMIGFSKLLIGMDNHLANIYDISVNGIKDIQTINTFIGKEFLNIRTFLNDPKTSETNLQTDIAFVQNQNKIFESYKNNFGDDYSNFIKSGVNINFEYSITLYYEKV